MTTNQLVSRTYLKNPLRLGTTGVQEHYGGNESRGDSREHDVNGLLLGVAILRFAN